jgi:hypothetical protein
MKAPLSVVILAAAPFLCNALFPIKFSYFEIFESAKRGFIGSGMFLTLYLMLKFFKSPILSFTTYDSLSKTKSSLSMIYTGFLLGFWISSNLFFISSSFEINPLFFYYSRVNSSISILSYSSLLLLDSTIKLRSKIPLLYSVSPSNVELIISPLSLLCITEYLSLSSVFYLIICEKMFSMLNYLLITYPYLTVLMIVLLLISLVLSLFLLKLFKSKQKAKS